MPTDTVKKLNTLVADFTVFYQKLRHYHWNVQGEQFLQLHAKFEEIYTEVGDVIDELAERIVGLGEVPPHTLAHMLNTTSLKEDEEVPAAHVMVKRTIADIEALNAVLVDALNTAEAGSDRTTVNLLDGIHDGLEGHLWMLKSWQGK